MGIASCPWVLEAPVGRRWHITVYAFGGKLPSAGSSQSSDDDGEFALSLANALDQTMDSGELLQPRHHLNDVCYDVGIMRDRQRPIKLQICGQGRRNGVSYQSDSNKVELELLSPDILRSFAPFLIKFEGDILLNVLIV